MRRKCFKGAFFRKDERGCYCIKHGLVLDKRGAFCKLCSIGQWPPPCSLPEKPPMMPGIWATGVSYPKVRTSLVIPVRNEQERLSHTLECALEFFDEILVVNDGGEVPEVQQGVGLINFREHMGIPFCRNYGGACTRGEHMFFADAHMDFSFQDCQVLLECVKERGGIAYPSIGPLDGSREWRTYGATFTQQANKAEFFIGSTLEEPVERYTRRDALVGAFYCMSRPTFTRLGGWLPTGKYGYNEQALSMKLFFYDIPIHLCKESFVRHMVKKTPMNRVCLGGPILATHYMLFSVETFTEFWMPRFENLVVEWSPSLEMRQERKKVEREKLRTDKEFFFHLNEQDTSEFTFCTKRAIDGV